MVDFLLFFSLLFFLPIRIFQRKKVSFFPKLLSKYIPDPQGRPVIWIHAVSLGEIKAARPLFLSLKNRFSNAFFLITTTTATGQKEAKRLFLEADAISFLPFDFRFVVRKWAQKLKPKLFLLVETDFWPNLLKEIQKVGGKIALVSGKLSSRSAKRFQLFSPFSKKLFSRFDLLCLQNEEYLERFTPLIQDRSKLFVTGNLKLDLLPESLPIPKEIESLSSSPRLTIASTHLGEEEKILEALFPLDLFFFLAPRHPERFSEVARLLERKKIPFIRLSKLEERRGGERVLLVDAMGKLPIFYRLSRLAIVGGSFVDRVGGHNVLEPCLYQIPSFFGPHMENQKEFETRVLSLGIGKKVSIEGLKDSVETFFKEEKIYQVPLRTFLQEGQKTTRKTLDQIERIFSL